ncbi:MAG: hypothetical protein R2747_13130 [Pyrinomonadaceae bacterium]
MRIQRVKILLFLLSVAILSATARGTTGQPVIYRIKPVPAADRTNLEISVEFKAIEPVAVKLPTDYFGTPRLHRFVSSFEGESGTVVKMGEAEDSRLVHPNKSGLIRLRYVLSYDPKILENNTYSPNVSARHFHLAGCQWALQIGGFEEKHLLRIEFTDLPKGWQIYSSLSSHPLKFEVTASFQDLITTAIGGGDIAFRLFKYQDGPVSVFIGGEFEVPDREIFEAARKIVALQRSYFNDQHTDFYDIVILPKRENVAGVRFENMFISFFKQDVTRQQLYLLMAHEMSHNWLTAEIIKPEEGQDSLRYAWFYEGVNDYFARKILLEGGLLSPQKFIELVNRDIINIAENPHRATDYDDLIEATKNRKYDQAFNKLSYYRGALMAFIWDARIRRSDRELSVGDLIRKIYKTASENGGSISEKTLFELAGDFGLDAGEDFEKHILRGEPIDFDADLFSRDYKIEKKSVPSFQPGFSIGDSYRNKKITGVEKDQPAYRAGLRNGMNFIEARNANRFGNAWTADRPLTVIVEIDGKERRFAYFPHGKPIEVLQFRLNEKIGSFYPGARRRTRPALPSG